VSPAPRAGGFVVPLARRCRQVPRRLRGNGVVLQGPSLSRARGDQHLYRVHV